MMASVDLDLMFNGFSGRLGNIVLYTRYDNQYARIYSIPVNPDTNEQKMIRKTFGDAVRSWQELPQPEKDKYNKKARRLPMSGYNLYISCYMKENIMNAGFYKAPLKHSHSTQRAYSSVSAAFCLNNSFDMAPVKVNQSPLPVQTAL
jgi:hypothetical protein